MLPVVSPAVLRWIIGSLGSALTAVAVAMSNGGVLSWQGIALAVGAALFGSLKTLPDTIKVGELPKAFQEYMDEVRNGSLPPEPVVTPSTPIVADIEQ